MDLYLYSPTFFHVPLDLMYTPSFQAVQFLIPCWSYHSFHTDRHGRVERIPASYPIGPGLSSGIRRNSSTTFSFHILSNSLFTNHHTTRCYPVSATEEHYVVGYAKRTGTSEEYGSSLHRALLPVAVINWATTSSALLCWGFLTNHVWNRWLIVGRWVGGWQGQLSVAMVMYFPQEVL